MNRLNLGTNFGASAVPERYLFHFNPYLEKDADQPNEPLGIKVVDKLAEVISTDETENHELFFDYFSPPWIS